MSEKKVIIDYNEYQYLKEVEKSTDRIILEESNIYFSNKSYLSKADGFKELKNEIDKLKSKLMDQEIKIMSISFMDWLKSKF